MTDRVEVKKQKRYTEIMTANHLNRLTFSRGNIRGLVTLKTQTAEESGNTALHVCQDPEAVVRNRKLLEADTLPLENWVLPWQKHTANIVRVSRDDRSKGAYSAKSSILETDGLYTTDPDTLIGVFTADCLGILFADETVPLVGAVHSGWKGTAQAITLNLIDALRQDGLFHPETLHVYFSPSLMPSSLEVGPEVVEQIEAMAEKHALDLEGCILPGAGDRSYLDNQAINARMLQACGIPASNLHLSGLDTKTSPWCFSYRRDGRDCGEHFSCIWIEDRPDDVSSSTPTAES